MRHPVVVVFAVVVPLAVVDPAAAQPSNRSPAIDAALGTPPAGSQPSQGSIDPGYTERKTQRATLDEETRADLEAIGY